MSFGRLGVMWHICQQSSRHPSPVRPPPRMDKTATSKNPPPQKADVCVNPRGVERASSSGANLVGAPNVERIPMPRFLRYTP